MAQREGVRPSQLLGGDFRALGTISRSLVTWNLGYLALVWATVIAGFALVAAYPHPLVVVAVAIVVSGRQEALLNVHHECIHSMFVPGRTANDRISIWLCASPCASPYWAARARHLAHHRLLGTDDDPDGPLHKGPGFSTRRRTVQTFAAGVVGIYAVKVVFADDAATPLDPAERRADVAHIAVTQLVLCGVTTLMFGWWVYPLVWLLPLGTMTVFSHQLRSFGEHALTPSEEGVHPDRLITTASHPVERFLVAPYRMNYHAEHHLFPWVPSPRLPTVQRRLDARPDAPPRLRRSSYFGTLRHYLRGLAA
jgi:fatty acid desaturase